MGSQTLAHDESSSMRDRHDVQQLGRKLLRHQWDRFEKIRPQNNLGSSNDLDAALSAVTGAVRNIDPPRMPPARMPHKENPKTILSAMWGATGALKSLESKDHTSGSKVGQKAAHNMIAQINREVKITHVPSHIRTNHDRRQHQTDRLHGKTGFVGEESGATPNSKASGGGEYEYTYGYGGVDPVPIRNALEAQRENLEKQLEGYLLPLKSCSGKQDIPPFVEKSGAKERGGASLGEDESQTDLVAIDSDGFR